MPDQDTERHNYKHHDSRPGSASDRSEQTASVDSFPASDPVAPTAAVGSRAVSPQEMVEKEHSAPPKSDDCVSVTARFRDREAAKLAVETLVREGPVDRRHAEIAPAGDAVAVRLTAPRGDAGRIGELLRKQADCLG
jgi:hypothetical protein